MALNAVCTACLLSRAWIILDRQLAIVNLLLNFEPFRRPSDFRNFATEWINVGKCNKQVIHFRVRHRNHNTITQYTLFTYGSYLWTCHHCKAVSYVTSRSCSVLHARSQLITNGSMPANIFASPTRLASFPLNVTFEPIHFSSAGVRNVSEYYSKWSTHLAYSLPLEGYLVFSTWSLDETS